MLMRNITMEALYIGFLVTIFFSFSSSLQVNDACTTPNRARGTCIPFKQCSALVALLEQQARPIPANILQFLRDSGCGFEGNTPLVCCASQPNQQGGRPPTTSTAQDVTRHRNVRLINSQDCGYSASDRIFNGQKTEVKEFPWMARLGYRINNRRGVEYRCGGTLISQRYVLTAAHCISKTPRLNLASVRLGEHDSSTEIDCEETVDGPNCAPAPVDVDVETTIVHPEYSTTKLVNDIALIRLARNVDFTEGVRPICLPVGLALQNINLDNKDLTVAGWGSTESGSSSTVLLKVAVPVMPLPQCAATYKSRFKYEVNYKQLCAGGSDRAQDSCTGDSGGPLKGIGSINSETRFIQYGIVSYGPRTCGMTGIPGIYTKVGFYMDWLLTGMKP